MDPIAAGEIPRKMITENRLCPVNLPSFTMKMLKRKHPWFFRFVHRRVCTPYPWNTGYRLGSTKIDEKVEKSQNLLWKLVGISRTDTLEYRNRFISVGRIFRPFLRNLKGCANPHNGTVRFYRGNDAYTTYEIPRKHDIKRKTAWRPVDLPAFYRESPVSYGTVRF